ncbi:hypothetical protein SAMN05216289_12927 [Dokdonella immobilis]|uniref:Uncharacterized protein n=1 Tax=Dokdonella immobilis TaxID=578942 RepID=A0A1I4ZV40_9GAMM|nr:hypothetical protein [Dokdonella immobilis]SFN54058.1 hypothetical protein SAMN05216289_12927 [Dokdonella immobilis]
MNQVTGMIVKSGIFTQVVSATTPRVNAIPTVPKLRISEVSSVSGFSGDARDIDQMIV